MNKLIKICIDNFKKNWINIHFRNKKKAIYTVLIGDYDQLWEPKYVTENWDYICFTDCSSLRSSVWDVRLINTGETLDPVRLNRKYKIQFYKYLASYDITIYVDANIEILKDLDAFLFARLKSKFPMSLPAHPERNCIYDESNVCIERKKDNIDLISRQVEGYRKSGLPKGYGLTSNGIIIRRNGNTQLYDLMDRWYCEVLKNSYRDQLSLSYVVWKTGFKGIHCFNFYGIFDYLTIHPHLNESHDGK